MVKLKTDFMKGSIYIGKIFGIKVLIHFTFFLIFVWVAVIGFSQGLNLERVLWECALVAVAFVCVIMHEFGHALTARRFKIQTKQILLLPIGGVAQLQRIPEKPSQELAVALGGPMVNVAIIALLLPIIALTGSIQDVLSAEAIEKSFIIRLAWINLALLVFNMIPAFPMDGGRVFRALLNMRLPFEKATLIAARTGQFFAVVLAVGGFYFPNYIMVIIAIFVFFTAEYEYRVVNRKRMVRGFLVKDAMLEHYTILNPLDTLQSVHERILNGEERDFLVVGEDNVVEGILTQGRLKMAFADYNFGPAAFVGTVMLTNFPRLDEWQTLDYALLMMKNSEVNILPVMKNNKWIGAVNSDAISSLAILRAGHSPKIA